MTLFRDRAEAGKRLAEALTAYANNPHVVVLALPRGGVPIAYEIAQRLGAPLELYVVRKLGVPGHEELAMGALASDGSYVLDHALIESLGISQAMIGTVMREEFDELRRREIAYSDDRMAIDLGDRVVVVTDDGLATGATMKAAAIALRRRAPAAIVIAVPVAAARTCALLEEVADDVVCLATPDPFHAVGLYYEDFRQVSDDQVRRLLDSAPRQQGAA